MSKTQPARGMRDFLPADIRKRNYVINIVKEVYESYGFEPLETPAVENLETLTGKYGEEGNQLIFKILKRGEKLDVNDKELADLALRYDLTVPLARVVANNRDKLPKFFKRYQIQPVWRADRPARGRFREFYQCDVDAIGSKSMVVEAELISAVCEILKRLGFEDFVVRVNHRKILFDLIQSFGIESSKSIDAITVIDKLDKIGFDAVQTELLNIGVDQKSIDSLGVVFENYKVRWFKNRQESIDMHNEGWFNTLGSLLGDHNGLNEIKNLLKFSNFNSSGDYVLIDPFLARGLSYYTGAIFEVVLAKGDFEGSVGGGGRYDGLIGMFGKEEIPACGLSIGLERILVVMEERGMFPPEIAASSAADVMVTIWNEEGIAESLKLANELRSAGLRVLLYPEADKMGKQFKYADSIGVEYVCVLGESELADGKVTLKNMKTGEQEVVSRAEAAGKISPQRR